MGRQTGLSRCQSSPSRPAFIISGHGASSAPAVAPAATPGGGPTPAGGPGDRQGHPAPAAAEEESRRTLLHQPPPGYLGQGGQ